VKTIASALLVAVTVFSAPPAAQAAGLADAKIVKVESDSQGARAQYPFIYPPISTRRMDAETESMSLTNLGHWANNNLSFLNYRVGEPTLLCVRGPSITKDATVWLESADLTDGQLTLEFGHSGKLIPKRSRKGEIPFFLVELGSFEAGDYKFGVRFVRFDVAGDQELDERDRPIGRQRADKDGDFIPAYQRDKLKFLSAAPLREGVGVSDDEFRRRVDAASSIVLIERITRHHETGIRAVTVLKGGGWYRDYEPLYKTVKPALLARPEDEWAWAVFLPWREDHPPLPAGPELIRKISASKKQPELWKDLGDDWQIGLRSKRDKLKVGDPIDIDIEIATRNRSEVTLKKLTFSLKEHSHYPAMKIELTTPDGKTHTLKMEAHKLRHADFPAPFTIGPGKSLVETISVDQWRPVDGGRWDLFAKPGEYKLRCLFASDRCKRLKAAEDDYSTH